MPILGVALLDFSHMLSYAGMPDYVTANSVAKGINFWLPARYLVAVSLLWALGLHWHAPGDSASAGPGPRRGGHRCGENNPTPNCRGRASRPREHARHGRERRAA